MLISCRKGEELVPSKPMIKPSTLSDVYSFFPVSIRCFCAWKWGGERKNFSLLIQRPECPFCTRPYSPLSVMVRRVSRNGSPDVVPTIITSLVVVVVPRWWFVELKPMEERIWTKECHCVVIVIITGVLITFL